jgi:hypothetical protein
LRGNQIRALLFNQAKKNGTLEIPSLPQKQGRGKDEAQRIN